jgi:archaellum biogenesis ATPase FlaH
MSTADEVLRALERYNLKKAGAGRYQFNSPFRAGADSMTCSLIIEGPEHGAFKDFHPAASPDKGSLYDLAKHLGIALPTSTRIESTKRPYAGLEDYAKAHGIPGDVLRSMNWREVMKDNRPALEYPTHGGLRWRFLDAAKGQPTYKSETGYQRCWYGLGNTLIEKLEAGQPLVLCNGEISTLAARHYGIPAIAMTGGEKAEIPHELMQQLRGMVGHIDGLTVLIAMDCDRAGRTSARGLEQQFRAEGFDARAVDLGLSTGGDLADFAMLHADTALEALLKLHALPAEQEQGKWHFATIEDVLRLPTIDWLVPRQIPARGLSMIYGASGTYKSFLILDHALKLAQTGTNILYIAAEGEYGYRQRLQAWLKHSRVDASLMQAITFVLGSVDLFDPDDSTEFARVIEQYKPKMIVVDTFAMCSGIADENSARDMLQIVNACKGMSRNLDAVIVIVHHTNAEGKKERGSKVMRNACDTVIRVSLDDSDILIESQKTKDTAPFDSYRLAPLSIELDYKNNIGEQVTSVVLIPAEKMLPGDDLTPLQRKVLEVLSVQPGASLAEIADAVEVDSRGTISKVISVLAKKSLVLVNGMNRELTPQGEKMLL